MRGTERAEVTLTPTVPLVTPSPTRDPSKPVEIQGGAEFTPPTSPDVIVQTVDVIVTGTVIEILAPRWTTPDQQRPANPLQSAPYPYTIVSPVVIELDGSPVQNRIGADLSANRVVLAAEGGQVGQDTIDVGLPRDEYEIGQRVLVGLNNVRVGSLEPDVLLETEAGPAWEVGMKYVLTEDGQAIAHDGTSQPAEELIAALQSAAQVAPSSH